MRTLKTTLSLCPVCLEKVPGRVVERDGEIWLDKTCPDHGEDRALLASDARLYWNAGGEPGACGTSSCLDNHSCTLIFEITERCNLTCPTCFAGSSPHLTWQMDYDDFVTKLDRLRARGKHDADMVQLSGGEPTLHPDIERMVAHCLDVGVRKVYINTNGLRLARDLDFVRRLAAADAGRDRLQFYVQFDGFAAETYATIRGAATSGSEALLDIKRRALTNVAEVGLFALPVMTVTRGVNDTEIGAVIAMMRDAHPRLNTVMLQPAFYSGRYENDRAEKRLTMAEVAHMVAAQTDGVFTADDFRPIPCSHPNCFALAVGLVRDGKVTPISRYFPRFETWDDPGVAEFVARLGDQMPQHMLATMADDETLDELLDLLAADGDDEIDWSDYRNFVLIGIKPFMDAHTYDQDRVDRCCVHIVDRAGEPVSLCEYNAVRRPRGQL